MTGVVLLSAWEPAGCAFKVWLSADSLILGGGDVHVGHSDEQAGLPHRLGLAQHPLEVGLQVLGKHKRRDGGMVTSYQAT